MYTPKSILSPETGLVLQREQFLIPDDAYVKIENAYTRLGKLRRKTQASYLGRLSRPLSSVNGGSLGNTNNTTSISFPNIFSTLGISGGHPQLKPTDSLSMLYITVATMGASTFTDNGMGGFTTTGDALAAGSSINYTTGALTLKFTSNPGTVAITISGYYYPGLPAVTIASQQINDENVQNTIIFDTKYAYTYNAGQFVELTSSTPTTWTGSDYQGFWTANYFRDASQNRLFWATNFSGPTGDPTRYYNTVTWTQFVNTGTGVGQVDAASPPNFVWQSRIIIPFRNQLLMMNTWEGNTLAGSVNYPNRIRYSAIGNPLTTTAWRDDIPGQGGFLTIPISENIISAGFVRDNLVIFCERSTWQLRYTGQAINPFQIERINSELGCKSPFGSVQFDQELVTIGPRAIVSCDSFSCIPIDQKIERFTFDYTNDQNNGSLRIQAVRDYYLRLAYWNYASAATNSIYPDYRLVYNYDEKSWAIFKDSYTCLGYFYPAGDITWNSLIGQETTWENANFPWAQQQSQFPDVIGANQQGFVLNISQGSSTGNALDVSNISGTGPTIFTIYNHNMQTNDYISFSNIPSNDPFAFLNGVTYQVVYQSANTIYINAFNASTQLFDQPVSASGTYLGYGRCAPAENFNIVTKKFNFVEQGQKIQLGFMDILTEKTNSGQFSMNVYCDYADATAVNNTTDTFFNNVISTSDDSQLIPGQSKLWQRVQCAVRANMLQLQFTLSPAQMSSSSQQSYVEIDAINLFTRTAGRIGT